MPDRAEAPDLQPRYAHSVRFLVTTLLSRFLRAAYSTASAGRSRLRVFAPPASRARTASLGLPDVGRSGIRQRTESMILDLVLDHEWTELILVRKLLNVAQRNPCPDALGQGRGGREEFGGESPRRLLVPRVSGGDQPPPRCRGELVKKERSRQPKTLLPEAAVGGCDDDRGAARAANPPGHRSGWAGFDGVVSNGEAESIGFMLQEPPVLDDPAAQREGGGP